MLYITNSHERSDTSPGPSGRLGASSNEMVPFKHQGWFASRAFCAGHPVSVVVRAFPRRRRAGGVWTVGWDAIGDLPEWLCYRAFRGTGHGFARECFWPSRIEHDLIW